MKKNAANTTQPHLGMKLKCLALLAVTLGVSAADVGCISEPNASSEQELQGEWPKAFGFKVEAMATFGSGHAGSSESEIDEPDGVVFTRSGLLLATDGINHRVDVFDPFNKKRLGQFGSPEIFHGNVVDLAIAPNGDVIVTDEDAHVAYPFAEPTRGADPASYKFKGADMFPNEGLGKVGGIAIDSKGRIYTVDARQNLVRRFLQSGAPDPSFRFAELGSTAALRACEGVVLDEKRGRLYVSSEGDSVVQVFDLADGHYLNEMVGGAPDPAAKPRPKSDRIFQAAVEGLAILDDYLLAVDEADGGVGRLHIFDLREKSSFNTEPAQYLALKTARKSTGYKGFFGDFLSPDSVTAYTAPDGQSYVAIADQGHYKVVVYRWSDILAAGKIKR
jgi:DNA-binding beta-propeller fold protein YncE